MTDRYLDPTDNTPLEEMDRRSLFHPNTALGAFSRGELGDPTIMTGAEGIRLRDSKGREYIDGFAALWCVNAGYGRTEIADAIHRQALSMAYYHHHAGHSSETVIRLSDRILRMVPGMSRVFWGLQGSDAHETQAKIVWYYSNARGLPKKKTIISRHRGYHGMTVMSGSMSGLPNFHRNFDLPLARVKHTVAPYYYWREDPSMSEADYARWCVDELERLILAEGPETVAAFIGEPVFASGGVLVPPQGYWPAVRALCDKYDILLMADEVVCGFGRVGVDFGSTLYDIRPDMMSISKGLTSGYFPLAGSLIGEKVWRVLEEATDRMGPFWHGFTYAAHPMGAAAGMANLDILEREGLTANAARVGAHLKRRLTESLGNHEMVGEVRGVGLMVAVEFVADRTRRRRFDPALRVGQRIMAAARERGLLVRALAEGEILAFAPPLIVTEADVDRMVEIATAAVTETADKLVAEGAWR